MFRMVRAVQVLVTIALMAIGVGQRAVAADVSAPVMRIFEFVLDARDVQTMLDVGTKNIQTSVRDEPGVLAMFCTADKDDPTKLYVVEVYRDQAAYQAHAESAHFKAFVVAIQGKVVSRRVIETNPAVLGAKGFGWTAARGAATGSTDASR